MLRETQADTYVKEIGIFAPDDFEVFVLLRPLRSAAVLDVGAEHAVAAARREHRDRQPRRPGGVVHDPQLGAFVGTVEGVGAENPITVDEQGKRRATERAAGGP